MPVKGKEQMGAKVHDSSAVKKEQPFVWMDVETELLLKVTLEYKVAKAAENIDWELVCTSIMTF